MPRMFPDGSAPFEWFKLNRPPVGVENLDTSRVAQPFGRSTALRSTPVNPQYPMEGAPVAQEMHDSTDEFPWPHAAEPLLEIVDEDGDRLQLRHVFVEAEHGAQVWLTAAGEDGQRVQVALSPAVMRSLGERLLDEAEDAGN